MNSHDDLYYMFTLIAVIIMQIVLFPKMYFSQIAKQYYAVLKTYLYLIAVLDITIIQVWIMNDFDNVHGYIRTRVYNVILDQCQRKCINKCFIISEI